MPVCQSHRKSYMSKSFLILTVLVFLTFNGARAQSPAESQPASDSPIYAVLSLVGDKLEVIGAQAQTGSRLDSSKRNVMEVNDPGLDNAVVTAIAKAVKASQPKAELSQLNTRSKVLFEKHDTLFVVKDGMMSMPEAIKDALKAEKATHMILVTKFRRLPDPTLASLLDSDVQVEGLGFFVDARVNTQTGGTNLVNRGYLAPYAYIKVTVAEVATGKLVGTNSVATSRAMVPAEVQRVQGMLWNAITDQEKLNALAGLIQSEMARVIPLILKAG